MRISTLISIILTTGLSAQTEYFPSDNIADCAGAVEILHPGSYTAEFIGSGGLVEDLIAYPGYANFKEKNSLFFKFTAPFDGRLSLDASVRSGYVQLLVFQNDPGSNIVGDILEGRADITRELRNTITPHVGLSMARDVNSLESIDLQAEETVIMLFMAGKRYTGPLDLTLHYDLRKDAGNADMYKKVVDERTAGDRATFYIQVRDEETGNPVIADVNIKDKKRSSLYSGSDLYFNTEKYSKLTIKCDAPGYFFLDRNITIYADSSKDLVINLKPVSKGKTLKIDKLEFVKGTADIIPGTEVILARVKDFLVLNSDLRIEIDGHVNNEGNDNLNTKKLSKKRARKIMHYFIQSGINRKRLSYKAFGSKQPIYANPRTEREAQANRRVEIKIL